MNKILTEFLRFMFCLAIVLLVEHILFKENMPHYDYCADGSQIQVCFTEMAEFERYIKGNYPIKWRNYE